MAKSFQSDPELWTMRPEGVAPKRRESHLDLELKSPGRKHMNIFEGLSRRYGLKMWPRHFACNIIFWESYKHSRHCSTQLERQPSAQQGLSEL